MGNSKKKKKSKKDNASWKLERMVEREVKKRLSGSRKKTKSRPKLKLRPISDTSSQSTDDDNSGSSGSNDPPHQAHQVALWIIIRRKSITDLHF